MAGTLSVQKIQGLASSATPTVVEVSSGHALHANTLKGTTTAGSITVQGEGTATTNLQQGLCKAWCFLNGYDAVIQDSFNVTYELDEGTGSHQVGFTNIPKIHRIAAVIQMVGQHSKTPILCHPSKSKTHQCQNKKAWRPILELSNAAYLQRPGPSNRMNYKRARKGSQG